MAPKRTIDANGNMITVADDHDSSSAGGAPTSNPLNSLTSMQQIDVFGFNVPSRQFLIGMVATMLLFGPRFGEYFCMILRRSIAV